MEYRSRGRIGRRNAAAHVEDVHRVACIRSKGSTIRAKSGSTQNSRNAFASAVTENRAINAGDLL
jgi:hypothetical protein